jgi:hypothetical protein
VINDHRALGAELPEERENRMSIDDTQPGPAPPDPWKQDPIDPPKPASPPEELPGPTTYPIHPDIPEQPIHEPTPEPTIA